MYRKSASTVYSHDYRKDGRSCLQVINEETAVTNKERSPEENFARDPPDSRGTELYRVARLLRVQPKAADWIPLIYLQTGPRYRGKVPTVPADMLSSVPEGTRATMMIFSTGVKSLEKFDPSRSSTSKKI